MITIIGLKIIDRIKEAGLTQVVLSRYSDLITTRLGFHELTTETCSREAYMILHINADVKEMQKLLSELKTIGGMEVREMVFNDNEAYTSFSSEEGALRFLGILMEKKSDTVAAVQKIFTAYGCVIRTRMGVNEDFFGNPVGLIILELMGDEIQMDLLERDLMKLTDVHLRKMTF